MEVQRNNAPNIESILISTLVNGSLGVSAPAYLVGQWFELLCSQYAQPYRKYYTLFDQSGRKAGRVEFMLAEFQRVEHLVKNPAPMIIAIMFRNFISVPLSKTNISDSVTVAKAFLITAGAPRITIGRVARLILATRHTREYGKTLRTSDERLIADLELMDYSFSHDASLGSAFALRSEFVTVTDEEFRKFYGHWLSGLVSRGTHMYQTDDFREKYGEQTVENMKYVLHNMSAVVHHRPRP